MEFYRYDIRRYSTSADDYDNSHTITDLNLTVYLLHKETPKGYWIGYGALNTWHGESKWVSKTSKKRFAYPTKAEALNSFIKRTEKRVKILEDQVGICNIGLAKAKKLLVNEK